MALISPGVQVNVIDESFYTPSAAGTVPMIFVATASNKTNSSGSGTAAGTLKSNANKPYLLTSQRELGELFGDPLFYSDANGNMIHGSELNEYGLQTAYSLLGVTNRVYVTRADFDLAKLEPSATPPGGEPVDGTYWFDTQVTTFGVLEWNSAPVNTTGGQSFTSISPRVIVDENQTVSGNAASGPKPSVGQIGEYAVVATSTYNRLWYKNMSGNWVEVGSPEWSASWSTVAGSGVPTSLTAGNVVINSTNIAVSQGNTLDQLVSSINSNSPLQTLGITAGNVDGRLELYSTGVDITVSISVPALSEELGISADLTTYYAPRVTVAPHTQIPEYKLIDDEPRPTGSIWLKTTEPNGGANFRIKRYNEDTRLWEGIDAPIYETNAEAIFNLDRSGGGANIVVGDLFVRANADNDVNKRGTWKIHRRVATGATVVRSAKIATQVTGGADTEFTMAETLANQLAFDSAKTISFSADGNTGDADRIAGAINSAGFANIVASVDDQNRVVITHKLGGEIQIVDTDGALTLAGFTPATAANLYYTPGTSDQTSPVEYTASNWKVLEYEASEDEPTTLTEDGEIWYNSIVDEVDIMIHNGNTWVGYQNFNDDYANTNAEGPIVSASRPTVQTNGSALVDGDLWIDTADIENYPQIYRYNGILQEWILIDKTDQTSENGIVFADARWTTNGGSSNTIVEADISELLSSDYLDPDAPDPALYPKGMLLWNMRRSGFNVKRFVRNYIDVDGDNPRQNDVSMDGYYPHRWVTESGNNEDGSGTFGRQAQRKSVTQALQAMVNSNQEIRDEESRQYNLIACPGYPELIGEMITLNYDRRLTAFVVGDTPARLTPDATSLNEWATNVRRAVEDNDEGAVSFDEYLGMYYPWGFTSDNAGNNVVVPPSYMSLRTLVLNDQVAYPWFAPAGTRRGGVTNATASGYIDAEGEFVSIALNTGQRDTLYSNNINPITFLSGSGLVVYGQKTRARNASALDRVNVARLVVYMRGQLERLARPYLFEPNDKITRDQIKAAADAFCLELVGLRGIYDFLVVCDETNNTPARIDRNELYLDIAIEPVKAIEFIYIPLRLKNTGEIASLG